MCKEKYNCTNCCEDMIMTMTLEELAVLAQAWIGHSIVYVPRKSSLRASARNLNRENTLFYACNRKLEEHKETGRFGKSQVVAVFTGLCKNNNNGNCGIYPDRPRACRNLEIDSRDCEIERDTVSPIELV